MAMISVYLKEYNTAIRLFDRVQFLYPDTPYALEAGVGKLAVFYKTGAYQQVTVDAGSVLSQPLARDQRVRVNLIVGDSYMAVKSPLDAYHAYLIALESAQPDEESKVISRLKTALSMLGVSDLSTELAKLDGRRPAGYLMYQLGVKYMDEGFTGDAVATFSSFIEMFPNHADAGQARQCIADLEASVLTDQHLIGCLLPLSGKYENFGNMALAGIEYALSEFARTRGAYTFRIMVKDTASDPLVAGEGVRELAESNVSAIIGPIATAEYASVQAQELRIPMIVLTQKTGITETGDYIFRNFLTPDMQIQTLVDYAVGPLAAKQFAILYPDESYGEVYMNLFWDEVIQAGGKVVGWRCTTRKKQISAIRLKNWWVFIMTFPKTWLMNPSRHRWCMLTAKKLRKRMWRRMYPIF